MTARYALVAGCLLGLCHGIPTQAETPGAAASETDAAPAPADTTSAPPPAANAPSDLDKVNYSLGYELGETLKRQQIGLEPETLLRGVEDALSGARPLVKPSERHAALVEIKRQRAQDNLERSQAFLVENAAKAGVETLPSGLQYREIAPGAGRTPGLTDRVTVEYRGTLIDGGEFDSSYARGKPSTFQVRKVIPGWREALQLMREGASWEIYVPPELAYGERSPGNRIPPNSALIFEVKLLSVEQGPPPQRRPAPRAPVGDEVLEDE